VRIYETQGEAAALEAAAREALAWTQQLLPESPRAEARAPPPRAPARRARAAPPAAAAAFFKPSARAGAAAAAGSGSESDDAPPPVLPSRARAAAAAAARPRRGARPALDAAAAATRIQAGVRGLIARRGAEVQRCRLDLRAALGEAKATPGQPHPEVLASMLDLGCAYARAWDFASAEQAYSCALESIEREYGAGDTRLVRPAEALARLLARRGEMGQAEAVLRRALAPPRAPGGGDDGYGAGWEGIGGVMVQMGAWLAAEGEELGL